MAHAKPAGQGVQYNAPSSAKLPSVQGASTPDSHVFPAGHTEHDASPAAEVDPMAHFTGSSFPLAGQKWSAGQTRQELAPANAYSPGPQGTGSWDGSAQLDPAGQGTHAWLSTSE